MSEMICGSDELEEVKRELLQLKRFLLWLDAAVDEEFGWHGLAWARRVYVRNAAKLCKYEQDMP